MATTRQPVTPDPNAVDPNANITEQPEDMRLRVISCSAFLRSAAKGGGVRYRSVLTGSDAAVARFHETQGQYSLKDDQGDPLYISQDSLEVGSYLIETNGRYGPEIIVSKELERLTKAQSLAGKMNMSESAQGEMFAKLIMGMV